jgi:uncharacterized membrane protein YeaQ/YmgE (transglycosylase-associated protein family)
MMTWIVILLAGAFIGWIASKIMGTDASMGALANIVVGCVGAVIGRFVSGLLFNVEYGTNFNPMALIFGIVGACILLAIVRAITGGRRSVAH